MKVSLDAGTISEQDFAAIAGHGFSDDDIWDIAAIAAFFALSEPDGQRDRDASERRVYLMGRLPK